jgi:hypothetical protein
MKHKVLYPIKLNFEYSCKEDLEEMIENSKLNQFLIENIFEPLKQAIVKNKAKCVLYEVGDFNYKVIVKKDEYKTLIDKILSHYEKKEDYDMCIELVKLKEKIK